DVAQRPAEVLAPATVLGAAYGADAIVGELGDDRGRVVRGRVVGHHDFEGGGVLAQDARERLSQIGSPVVRRHENADALHVERTVAPPRYPPLWNRAALTSSGNTASGSG